jgi:hypothetical protein
VTICTPWRVGNSLNKLLDQANRHAPNRSKESDGSIGDAAHQAEACGSQHNSCCVKYLGVWIVRARDFTHDPAHGFDSFDFAERLRLSRDPRIRYVISNRRITGPNYGWQWHAYSGDDPHTNHAHVSVWDDAARFDNTADWALWEAELANTQEDGMTIVQIKNGDPNGAGIYDAVPGAVYHITAADWAAWPDPKPALSRVPWSYVAGLAATKVMVPEDVLSAAEIAAFADAVAAKVVQNPSNPAQAADAQAIAEAVADELTDRMLKGRQSA